MDSRGNAQFRMTGTYLTGFQGPLYGSNPRFPTRTVELDRLQPTQVHILQTANIGHVVRWIRARAKENCDAADAAEVVPSMHCAKLVGGKIGFAV